MGFSRRQKKILGIASIWPAAWMLVFLASFVPMALLGEGQRESAFTVLFVVLFAGQALTIVETFAVVAYYIAWMMRQEHVPDQRKTLWVVILLMGNALALPIFWFLYVHQGRPLAPEPLVQPWRGTWQPPPPPVRD